MEHNIFEYATRNKVRFDTPYGLITTEDLWGIPLKYPDQEFSLDTLAVELYNKLEFKQTSFVDKEAQDDDLGRIRFQIVRHIIDVKLTELEAAKSAALKSQRKAKLMELIVKKQDAQLAEHSIEELQAMIDEL